MAHLAVYLTLPYDLDFSPVLWFKCRWIIVSELWRLQLSIEHKLKSTTFLQFWSLTGVKLKI